jgi:hypothetical protein
MPVDADSTLLHLRIPNVNGLPPFPTIATIAARGANASVPRTTSGLDTYAFGLAVHQNLLSKLLYEAVIQGLLCIWIDPSDPNNDLGSSLGSILTTDLFGFFVPYLADNYPGMPIAVRALPLLALPSTLKYYSPPQNQGQKIRDYLYLSGGVTDVTQAVTNPIPRIQTGGLTTYDFLRSRFLSAITTTYLGPLWPDLSVIIPHFLVEFYVVDTSTSPKTYRRAFALDIGFHIGLNIDVVQDPGVAGGSTFMDPLAITFPALARPSYSGTNFPIGCGPNSAYPCEITGVPSRLVLFLGGVADPELNATLIYDEMAATITHPSGAVTNVSAFAIPNTSAYIQAISNLIGLVLSGELNAFVEIGLDPAAFLNIPIVVTIP